MQAKAAIYLDSNAGAPLHPSVVKALLHFLGSTQGSLIANSSSNHFHGRQARRQVSEAKESILHSLGSASGELFFCSSGTESNQFAIRSILEDRLNGAAPHWVTTPVEHESVLVLVEWFKKHGGQVSFLPVDKDGLPQVEQLASICRPETALVSLIWVNNETGVITDVRRASEILKPLGIPLHLDGAQAWGKQILELDNLGADFVSFSGHKIGALPGSGLLWARDSKMVKSLILGKQQDGKRGGTENIVGIISLGAAAAALDPVCWSNQVALMRIRLEEAVLNLIPGSIINGVGAPRAANTINFSFQGIETSGLVAALDLAGYSVSSGAACASGTPEPSQVLLAMGKTENQAKSAIRVSISSRIEWSSLEGFVTELARIVSQMRKTVGAQSTRQKVRSEWAPTL